MLYYAVLLLSALAWAMAIFWLFATSHTDARRSPGSGATIAAVLSAAS